MLGKDNENVHFGDQSVKVVVRFDPKQHFRVEIEGFFMFLSCGNWDLNLIRNSECFRCSSFLNQNKRKL